MADLFAKICAFRAVRDVNRHRRRVILFKERKNPFTFLSAREFKRRYRFSKETAKNIINLVKDELEPLQQRRNTISAEMQVLVTLRYFAKGMYQEDNGDLHGISQQCVSKIVRNVSVALALHLGEYVKLGNLEKTKLDFYSIAGFPSVIGCVDCTHIKIKNPDKERPLLYCNRKGWYSLNVQVVCDARCRIVDLVARWRGSAHDARIWDDCCIKQKLETGQLRGIILGDSGYPCTNYLLTPLHNPVNQPQNRYNSSHIRTRSTIERCFGRWKATFRALQNGMLLSLDTTKAAIAAMAVLHNIRINAQQSEEDSDLESSEDESRQSSRQSTMPEPQQNPPTQPSIRGNMFREQFIHRHFNL